MSTPSPSLHIGIWSARWPPAHLGGAELQAARLARELALRGHRVHVFTRAEGVPDLESSDGVTLHRRRTLPLPGLRLAGECIAAPRATRGVRLDVSLCFITLNSGLLGYVVRRARGTPFVVAVRGQDEALPAGRSWRKRLERFVHARADRVWVQSTQLVTRMRQAYAEDGRDDAWQRIETRLRVVPNGVDLPAPVADTPPPPRFLFVGRLVPEKDLPTLIAAVRALADVDVDVVGDGPLAEQLQRHARGTRMRFLGRRAPHDIPALLRACRGLVLCSKSEGLPNVVLEALAHARPVIATPVGAIPDLVENGVNGDLVPVGSPQALADAMRNLCDDELWSKRARAARPSVERFAWSHVVGQVERELRETARLRRTESV